jgi:hypothetical protein
MEETKVSFVVSAFRWGKRENHSYVVGVFTDISKAIAAANSEVEYRGGKYACVIELFETNKYDYEMEAIEIYKTPNWP